MNLLLIINLILLVVIILLLIKKKEEKNDDKIIKTLDDQLNKNQVNNVEIMKNLLNIIENKMNNYNQNMNQQNKEIILQMNNLNHAQKEMIELKTSIRQLEKVLNDKKARGTFGEIQLQYILEMILGENNKNLFERQKTLSNNKKVDFLLHCPDPIGDICIDSKFPLEAYNKIMLASNEEEMKKARKQLKLDLKKHIDDIKNKYIITGETSNQAILFLPSETIFAEINAYHEDVLLYAYEKHVWITSPTTIITMLNLILIVIKDLKRSEFSHEIYNLLNNLKQEFIRFDDRWQTLNKDIDKLYNDTKKVDITANKIINRFNQIESVEFDENN